MQKRIQTEGWIDGILCKIKLVYCYDSTTVGYRLPVALYIAGAK
jgi:hypothetical protein